MEGKKGLIREIWVSSAIDLFVMGFISPFSLLLFHILLLHVSIMLQTNSASTAIPTFSTSFHCGCCMTLRRCLEMAEMATWAQLKPAVHSTLSRAQAFCFAPKHYHLLEVVFFSPLCYGGTPCQIWTAANLSTGLVWVGDAGLIKHILHWGGGRNSVIWYQLMSFHVCVRMCVCVYINLYK